jgi:hypothetical protein
VAWMSWPSGKEYFCQMESPPSRAQHINSGWIGFCIGFKLGIRSPSSTDSSGKLRHCLVQHLESNAHSHLWSRPLFRRRTNNLTPSATFRVVRADYRRRPCRPFVVHFYSSHSPSFTDSESSPDRNHFNVERINLTVFL